MKHFSAPRKPFPIFAQIGIVVVLTVSLAFGLYWGISLVLKRTKNDLSQVDLLSLWNQADYDGILTATQKVLARRPLKTEALIFQGFAAFQKGVGEVSVEKKLPFLEESIISLRKALLFPSVPLQPQIHYILGKDYFHKGKFYADLAVEELTLAQKEGYIATDLDEYLGLSYSLVGRYREAAEYFLKAVLTKPSDLLLWTLGQTYDQMSQYDDAVKYLLKCISSTHNQALEQKARFLLGSIYTKTKQYGLAQNEYQSILTTNPSSADAHYYLGEIALAQGSRSAAEIEWRKAFKIDPLHFNANQRLFNDK